MAQGNALGAAADDRGACLGVGGPHHEVELDALPRAGLELRDLPHDVGMELEERPQHLGDLPDSQLIQKP